LFHQALGNNKTDRRKVIQNNEKVNTKKQTTEIYKLTTNKAKCYNTVCQCHRISLWGTWNIMKWFIVLRKKI